MRSLLLIGSASHHGIRKFENAKSAKTVVTVDPTNPTMRCAINPIVDQTYCMCVNVIRIRPSCMEPNDKQSDLGRNGKSFGHVLDTFSKGTRWIRLQQLNRIHTE